MSLGKIIAVIFLIVSSSVNASDIEAINDGLVAAAARGDISLVKKYLQMGADVDARHSESGFTALVTAAGKGDVVITRYLLSQNASLDLKGGPFGADALSVALLMDSQETIDLLLDRGAKLQKTDAGLTPLMLVGNTKNVSIVKRLISMGADVNDSQPDGWTPLMHAAYRRNLPVIKVLVDNGAEIDLKNSDGDTAIDIARSREDQTIAAFLQESNVKNKSNE